MIATIHSSVRAEGGRSDIVLSDFDASLELCSNGTLEPDAPRTSSFGFQAASKVGCFDLFVLFKAAEEGPRIETFCFE